MASASREVSHDHLPSSCGRSHCCSSDWRPSAPPWRSSPGLVQAQSTGGDPDSGAPPEAPTHRPSPPTFRPRRSTMRSPSPGRPRRTRRSPTTPSCAATGTRTHWASSTSSKATPVPETSYTDSSVAAASRYGYRVKSVSPTGVSKWSGYVKIDTPAAPTPTPTPAPDPTPTPEPEPESAPADLAATNLTTTLAEGGGVALSWSAPAEDADSVTGYEILRAVGEGEMATLVADTASTGDCLHRRDRHPGGRDLCLPGKGRPGRGPEPGIQPGPGPGPPRSR